MSKNGRRRKLAKPNHDVIGQATHLESDILVSDSDAATDDRVVWSQSPLYLELQYLLCKTRALNITLHKAPFLTQFTRL